MQILMSRKKSQKQMNKAQNQTVKVHRLTTQKTVMQNLGPARLQRCRCLNQAASQVEQRVPNILVCDGDIHDHSQPIVTV